MLKYEEGRGRADKCTSHFFFFFFFPQDMEAPKLDPKSHRVKDHGCLHSPLIHTALSDQAAAGTRKTAVPTTHLHVVSSQNAAPAPPGIRVRAELNHLEDQSLTANILSGADE